MTALKIFSVLCLTSASAYYVWQLQLVGYFWRRGVRNIFSGFAFWLSVVLTAVQAMTYVVFADVLLFVSSFCCLLLSPLVFSAKKTPLKPTKRVLRWFVVNCAFFVALTFAFDGCVPVILVLPVTFAADLLLKPINGLINAGYLKKAEKKLKSFGCTTIAVTGSYGKTSVKNVLCSFLSTRYEVACSPSSFNTPLGLAKFINDIKDKPQVVILEAGAKKRGDIAAICRRFRPDHALICGVAPQHIETFGNVDEIIATKGEVLDFLNNESFCVVNADDVNSNGYTGVFQRLSVGKNGEDFSLKNVSVSPQGTRFTIVQKDNARYDVFTPLLGSVNAFNVTMAFAMAISLGCTPSALITAAERLQYTPHRLELIRKGSTYILDDGYNANPKGVDGFLEVLSCFEGNKCVVAQGIAEAGGERFKLNYDFAKKLAKIADFCAVLGQNTDALKQGLSDGGMSTENIFVCDDLNGAVKKISAFAGDGGVIAFQNDMPDNMTKRRKK